MIKLTPIKKHFNSPKIIILSLSLLLIFGSITINYLYSEQNKNDDKKNKTTLNKDITKTKPKNDNINNNRNQPKKVIINGKFTPSHVYQQVQNIISEINLIRSHRNVTIKPRDPGKQVKKMPLHAYSKSIEVLEKIARFAKENSMEAINVPGIPLREITPGQVFDSTQTILEELRKIKSKLGISATIIEAPFKDGKSPSNVYESMWKASYLMDGLVPAITPSHVYHNVRYMIQELSKIASHFNISIESTTTDNTKDKKPEHVMIENYINMFKLARIERKIKMYPFYVPPLPGGKITPSNVYDTTNMVLAELVRIKVFLKITSERTPEPEVTGKTPSDAFIQMKLFQKNLDHILSSLK